MPNTNSGKIYITQDLDAAVSAFLQGSTYSHTAIIVDENTEEHCLTKVKNILPDASLIKIPSGEVNKTLATCSSIWQQMTDLAMDRKGLIINLGGGVIGDMGGFCASTYKRGIDFIQIPTTLLSQVDASVGGKLGVDFNAFKNHIGVFCNPQAVFIHTPFIETLDVREVRSGFAEIIKHCLIWDKAKWEELITQPFEVHNWNDLVPHSIEVKKKVVTEDPTEQGLRKILNFGHTIGHAIESYFLTKNKPLPHGFAVAWGIVAETYISYRMQLIPKEVRDEIYYIVSEYFPKVSLVDFDYLLSVMRNDKKNKNGVINFTLLSSVGSCEIDQKVEESLIFESLNFIFKEADLSAY